MDKKLFKILILLILFIPNNVYGVTINESILFSGTFEDCRRYMRSISDTDVAHLAQIRIL